MPQPARNGSGRAGRTPRFTHSLPGQLHELSPRRRARRLRRLPGAADQPAEDRWTPHHLSLPVLSRITKVPVDTSCSTTPTTAPRRARAPADAGRHRGLRPPSTPPDRAQGLGCGFGAAMRQCDLAQDGHVGAGSGAAPPGRPADRGATDRKSGPRQLLRSDLGRATTRSEHEDARRIRTLSSGLHQRSFYGAGPCGAAERSMRCSRGLTPWRLLKARVKCEASLKPTA